MLLKDFFFQMSYAECWPFYRHQPVFVFPTLPVIHFSIPLQQLFLRWKLAKWVLKEADILSNIHSRQDNAQFLRYNPSQKRISLRTSYLTIWHPEGTWRAHVLPVLSLLALKWNIPYKLGKHYGCWCSASLCHKIIMRPYFIWGWALPSCVKQMSHNVISFYNILFWVTIKVLPLII